MRSRLLGVAIALGLGFAAGACGDDNPYVQNDPGAFTAFVIDLVNNHTDDPTPVSYETFKDLPDPDGDNNIPDAYDGLFN